MQVPSTGSGQALRLRSSQSARTTSLRMTRLGCDDGLGYGDGLTYDVAPVAVLSYDIGIDVRQGC